jgi:MFS family permease
MTNSALRRNRDFVLYQAGQLLSSTGTQLTSVAYPLLVLAITGSPARAGIVAFAGTAPLALLAIPAGLAADRWSRRALMIGADLIRATAVGTLAILIATGELEFWVIVVIAFVEGCGAAIFTASEPGALRGVVPPEQLADAIGVQTGRKAAVQVGGPPIGAALFGFANALPFGVDSLSYACSTASLLAMRTPFQQPKEKDTASLRERLASGIRFTWRNPFLRTTALLFGFLNFTATGLVFSVVVVAKDQGLRSVTVGLLVGSIFAAVVIGSALSPFVRRRLPVHAVLVLEMWGWCGCAAYLVWPNAYVLAISLWPVALVIASTDSVVHGLRIAMTPDAILGRAESVRTTIALSMAPLGPLIGGFLLTHSSRAAIGMFAVSALALALWGTFSTPLRNAPRLDEIAGTSD